MADLRITELLASGTPLAGSEVLPVVQTDTTKKVTVANLTAGRAVSAASYTDTKGNVRAIPKSGTTKTSNYTLTTADNGCFIEVGTGGSITIPDAVFSTGNAVAIFNNTSGNITITCSITTAYISGLDVDKATMTLATRGLAVILFISGTTCVVSSNNVS